jgi:hypothetical protein
MFDDLPDPQEGGEPQEVLDTVVTVAPEDLTDTQKTFLQEHTEDLTDEQKETFKEVIKKDEEPVKPEVIEPETRTTAQIKEDKKVKTEEDEEEIDPDDEKTIGKVVERRMKPVTEALEQLQKVKDEQEVDSFIRSKPEYGKYRDVMIKYVQHPAYANIPVHNIAAIVAARDLQKLGAEKEREASKKAQDTKGNAQPIHKVPGGKPDWSKASKEDFEAQRARVLGQG